MKDDNVIHCDFNRSSKTIEEDSIELTMTCGKCNTATWAVTVTSLCDEPTVRCTGCGDEACDVVFVTKDKQ